MKIDDPVYNEFEDLLQIRKQKKDLEMIVLSLHNAACLFPAMMGL